mmetsp:Transcript_39017/g.54936  ORF Transcript_39017/g.54936 Transcript_39017/m.54936 type:complete len:209 (-) Transcript_39017:14-640(-)
MAPVGWLLWAAAGIMSSTVAVKLNWDKIDFMLMGLFRDLGRAKAYRRRYANTAGTGLVQILMKQDDVLLGLENEPEGDVPSYTVQELWEYGNGDNDNAILLSIFGRIYDVTEGEKFYGPGGTYGMFAGRDVSYSLSTGCRSRDCLEKSAEDLTEKQMLEGKRWLSFFQLHDKYPYVGKLDNNPMEELMNKWVEEAMASGEKIDAPILE